MRKPVLRPEHQTILDQAESILRNALEQMRRIEAPPFVRDIAIQTAFGEVVTQMLVVMPERPAISWLNFLVDEYNRGSYELVQAKRMARKHGVN